MTFSRGQSILSRAVAAVAATAASICVLSAVGLASPRVTPGDASPRTVTEHASSMEPTIKAGDKLKLDRSATCCRRGDIVAFNPGKKNSGRGFFIYRVIALPGETITGCAETHVCINGVQLKESYVPKRTPTNVGGLLPRANIDVDLPPQLVCEPGSPEGGCTVPSAKVFVMGDNRTNSRDSRVEGPVRMSWIAGTLHPPGT